jgi:hypothetical protein
MTQGKRATASQIAAARGFYQDEDLEIDDNALVSESEDEEAKSGCWVSAWVWVPTGKDY